MWTGMTRCSRAISSGMSATAAGSGASRRRCVTWHIEEVRQRVDESLLVERPHVDEDLAEALPRPRLHAPSAAAICSSVTTPRLTSSSPNRPFGLRTRPDAVRRASSMRMRPGSRSRSRSRSRRGGLWPLAGASALAAQSPARSPMVPAGHRESLGTRSTRPAPSATVVLQHQDVTFGRRNAVPASNLHGCSDRSPGAGYATRPPPPPASLGSAGTCGALESPNSDSSDRRRGTPDAPSRICSVTAMRRTLFVCSVAMLGFLGRSSSSRPLAWTHQPGLRHVPAYASKAAFCGANDAIDRATASATSPANALGLLKSHAHDLATMKANAPSRVGGDVGATGSRRSNAAIVANDANDLANLPNSGPIDAYRGVDGTGQRLPANFAKEVQRILFELSTRL